MLSHTTALFLAMDGNFRLTRKRKPGDPNDFDLSDGASYFVKAEEYEAYLKDILEDSEVAFSIALIHYC